MGGGGGGGGGLFSVEMFIKCCGLLTYYCNLFNFLKFESCKQCIDLKMNLHLSDDTVSYTCSVRDA